MELEARHARQGAYRGTDFGGEVGESGKVTAREGSVVGEKTARKLHPIAGVASELDDDGLFFLRLSDHKTK
jgi:hypothetical protein